MLRPARDSKYYTASDLRRVIGQVGFAIPYVRGCSMRPMIWEGSHYVVIVPLEDKPQIGDILAFEQIRRGQTAYILHRLVDIEQVDGADVYVMRGDNCVACERIRKEDIIGKMSEVYRYGKRKLWHAVRKDHFELNDKEYIRYANLWKKSWPIRRRLYQARAILLAIKHKLTWKRDTE